MKHSCKQFKLIIYPILLAIFLSACNEQVTKVKLSQLQTIKHSGELKVGILYHPLSYFFGNNENASGFDYELAQQFAEYLGVNLKIMAKYNADELQTQLQNGNIDFIAHQYQYFGKLDNNIKLSPTLYTVDQVLVYKSGSFRPKSFKLVNDTVWLIKGSPQESLMHELSKQFPEIQWQVTADTDEEELLRKVSEQEIKYALVDSHNLSLNQRFYPSLARAITAKSSTSVHWQLKAAREDSLQAALLSFIAQQYKNGDLKKLKDKYFAQFAGFDYVDTREFLKAIKHTLPKYEKLFKQYAINMDWRLLASISYQESHWKPLAKSPTGVRGIMMLTNATAKEVGVTNRLDPEQSIRGGVQYLQNLLKRLPATITKDEQYWFALAAYNIGFGHLMDARNLTKLRGQNPNSWSDVKANLPLLMQRRWNRKTRYGYARGSEAADYVLNIRQYYQSLIWQDAINEKNKAIAEQNEKFKKLLTSPSHNYLNEEAFTISGQTTKPSINKVTEAKSIIKSSTKLEPQFESDKVSRLGNNKLESKTDEKNREIKTTPENAATKKQTNQTQNQK